MTTEPTKIRVLIADDDAHVRHLVRLIVMCLGGDVVAEAADGVEAVEMFAKHRPQVAILDLDMPRMRGDEALARIMAFEPRTVAIMLTRHASSVSMDACLRLGARRYVLKNTRYVDIQRQFAECWRECRLYDYRRHFETAAQ